jgi:hypothetical protein
MRTRNLGYLCQKQSLQQQKELCKESTPPEHRLLNQKGTLQKSTGTLELNTIGDLRVATGQIGLIIGVGLHESPSPYDSSCCQNKVLVNSGGQPSRLVPTIAEEHDKRFPHPPLFVQEWAEQPQNQSINTAKRRLFGKDERRINGIADSPGHP